jgi:putative NADPH-quinone reductase
MKKVLVLDGHPDRDRNRLQHALMHAYAEAARQAGHEVRTLALSTMTFPLLSGAAEFENGKPPDAILTAQQAILWADHVLIGFPLWLGGAPAKLKGLFEQTFRPGFAFDASRGRFPRKLLAGKSARLVVTMGMPSLFFQLVYRAHGAKSVERNILAFCGFRPVRTTLIGGLGAMPAAKRAAWIEKLERFGRTAT